MANSDIHVSNELFLCGVAWIIHHEFAHVRLGHPPLQTIQTLNEEREADLEATEFILANSRVHEESQKRMMGIATAILALQGITRPMRNGMFQTHPCTYERIEYCLSAAGAAENDEVFLFAAIIVQIQLSNFGVNKALSASSYKELFEGYLIEFARAYSRSN